MHSGARQRTLLGIATDGQLAHLEEELANRGFLLGLQQCFDEHLVGTLVLHSTPSKHAGSHRALSLRAGAYLLNSRDSRISLLVGIARCRQRLLQVLYLARVLQLGLDLADAVQVLLGRDERALQQVVEIVQLLLEGLGPVRWDLFDYTTRDSNPAVDETLARERRRANGALVPSTCSYSTSWLSESHMPYGSSSLTVLWWWPISWLRSSWREAWRVRSISITRCCSSRIWLE